MLAPQVTAIREPQSGGSQAMVADLSRGLAVRGHEVHVYAARGSELPGVDLIDTGADPEQLAPALLHPGRPRRTSDELVQAYTQAYRSIGAGNYDVVHNHGFDAAAIALAQGLAVPVVHTLHLPPEESVALALAQAQRVEPRPVTVVVSQSQARAWARVATVDAVISNGVPTARIRPSLVEGNGALWAGRLSAEKGALQAIEIAARARMPLTLCGGAYDLEYAAEVQRQAQARSSVRLSPPLPREQLWQLMGEAAVVVCPFTWEEPFGLVAAESQACGTPVVAYRQGALPEVVLDGVTGVLVDPGAIDAAAAALGTAQTLARRACRRHAEDNLDLERCIDAYEALYRRLTEQRGGRTRGAA